MFILKTGLSIVAGKVFDKAGGLKGLKDKGVKLADNVKTHANEVTNAVKDKSTEKGAEAIGSIVGDVVKLAKNTGTAAIEMGIETVEETKEQIKEIKKVFSSKKPPKV